MSQTSDEGRIRFVGDIDAEPEPLRSQLWELVMAGAAELDDLDNAESRTQAAES